MLTSSTGNAFPQCSLLFCSSTSTDLSFMFSLYSLPVSTNSDVYKHASSMFTERKKCQCCKTRDPQELDLPTELSKSYKKSHCSIQQMHSFTFFPSKWLTLTPLYSSIYVFKLNVQLNASFHLFDLFCDLSTSHVESLGNFTS